ncbi:hypothetical protein COLO4_08980 [Corchorus olitorius]|uniref:Uncharacterized protein n=1 Tax=Corchorus olitorius TaxID=93759 RepID=A0A1R3KDS9_9ROSI|nr:hypothetical protein COLO4_08980 [Corchorus olitorius]
MAKMSKVLHHKRRGPKYHRCYIISVGGKNDPNAKGITP